MARATKAPATKVAEPVKEEVKEVKKAPKVDVEPGEELVEYTYPKDFRVKGIDTFYARINGDEVLVTPGEKQMMKKKFADMLDDQWRCKVAFEGKGN